MTSGRARVAHGQPPRQAQQDAGLAQRPDVGVGRITVGDQDVYGVRAAVPGEGALAELAPDTSDGDVSSPGA